MHSRRRVAATGCVQQAPLQRKHADSDDIAYRLRRERERERIHVFLKQVDEQWLIACRNFPQ
jgi:hypothetical protein